MVAIECLLTLNSRNVVRVCLQVLNIRTQLIHRYIVIILREARISEGQIDQLEDSLDIFWRTITYNLCLVVVRRHIYTCVLARELLAQIGSRELRDTHTTHKCWKERRWPIQLIRERRLTEVSNHSHLNLVCLELGRLHNHLHTILQGPLGCSECLVLRLLLHSRALQLLVGRDKRLLNCIISVWRDCGSLNLCQDLQALCLGWIYQTLALWSLHDKHLIVIGDILLHHLVNHRQLNIHDNCAIQLPLCLSIRHSSILAECVQVALYILTILAVVTVVVCQLLHLHYALLCTLQLAFGKAVTTDALQLGVSSLDTCQDFTILSVNIETCARQCWADADAAIHKASTCEWSIWFHCNLAETGICHLVCQRINQSQLLGNYGIIQLLW